MQIDATSDLCSLYVVILCNSYIIFNIPFSLLWIALRVSLYDKYLLSIGFRHVE